MEPLEEFTPGVAPIRLSKEPLGTQGELTPGPDELDPELPDERRELQERGYLSVDDVDADKVEGVSGEDEPQTNGLLEPIDPPEEIFSLDGPSF